MLDRNFIRDNLDRVRERLSGKGFEFDLNGFEKLDKREKSLRVENEELRALRNQTSEQISLRRERVKTPPSTDHRNEESVGPDQRTRPAFV